MVLLKTVSRSTIPEGYYAYDLRSGIDGRIRAIEKHEIKVDHAGTRITKKEVDFCNSTVKELGTTFQELSGRILDYK